MVKTQTWAGPLQQKIWHASCKQKHAELNRLQPLFAIITWLRSFKNWWELTYPAKKSSTDVWGDDGKYNPRRWPSFEERDGFNKLG